MDGKRGEVRNTLHQNNNNGNLPVDYVVNLKCFFVGPVSRRSCIPTVSPCHVCIGKAGIRAVRSNQSSCGHSEAF